MELDDMDLLDALGGDVAVGSAGGSAASVDVLSLLDEADRSVGDAPVSEGLALDHIRELEALGMQRQPAAKVQFETRSPALMQHARTCKERKRVSRDMAVLEQQVSSMRSDLTKLACI
jgi:hypothetical protein